MGNTNYPPAVSRSLYSSLDMSKRCDYCGKAVQGLKECKACKLVKYCNVDCQVAHRSMHKEACRKRADELFDEKLYADPPRREGCPICCLPLPLLRGEIKYQPCCGKTICLGCFYCLTRDCFPFCNTPEARKQEEAKERLLERVEKYNDPEAINLLGTYYKSGECGCDIDHVKAVELFGRASELGCANGHLNLGDLYLLGEGIEKNKKKAIHHYQIAAMLGKELARHYLGIIELEDENMERGMRHFMIAAKCGYGHSLDEVKIGYTQGVVTKDNFEKALRAYQASREETKSEQRDRAPALLNIANSHVGL